VILVIAAYPHNMSVEDRLKEFEEVLVATHPLAAERMEPGASDDEIAQLREAIAPYGLPAPVEALLRWHNGTAEIFGGYGVSSVSRIMEERDFWLSLEYPSAWLHVFNAGARGHAFAFHELDTPSADRDPAIWGGFTSDSEIYRRYDSIEAMAEFCRLVVESGATEFNDWGLGLAGDGGDFHEDQLPPDLAKLRSELNPESPTAFAQPLNSVYDSWERDEWPISWLDVPEKP
jgi:hypothetical protein